MKYLSVADMAKKWGISERSARNYCTTNRVVGAVLIGKTWAIPEDAPKPERKKRAEAESDSLTERLTIERKRHLSGGIYSRLQIDFAYTSLSLSSRSLSSDQIALLYEANSLVGSDKILFDDAIVAVNHFDLVDMMIDKLDAPLSDALFKGAHKLLGRATRDARYKPSFFGEYRKTDNTDGEAVSHAEIDSTLSALINRYESSETHALADILAFMVSFLEIRPFEKDSEIVGRLVAFKECLRNGLSPFLIDSELSEFYLKGIIKWNKERAFLINAVELAQEKLREVFENYGIKNSDEDDR